VVGESPAEGVLGPGTAFEGLLTFRGAMRIEGRLSGDVRAEGRLVIGPEAQVRARVQVDELVVAGLLVGDVVASRRVEIQESARLEGSVQTPSLQVAEGGVLDGQLITGSAAQAGPGANPDEAGCAAPGALPAAPGAPAESLSKATQPPETA
jgi:cytoskeletal protein CcmA (bactofilin family)